MSAGVPEDNRISNILAEVAMTAASGVYGHESPYNSATGSGQVPTDNTATGSGHVPTYNTATGSGHVPMYNRATGSGHVPMYNRATGSGKAPMYNTATGSGQVPADNTSTGSGQVPTDNTATGSGQAPMYNTATGSGQALMYNTATGSGQVPIYNRATGSGQALMYNTATGSGQVPMYSTATGSGQVPMYNRANGSGHVPTEYLHSRRNVNGPVNVGVTGHMVIPGTIQYPQQQNYLHINNYASGPPYMYRGTSVSATQNIQFSTNLCNVERGVYPVGYAHDQRNIHVISNDQMYVYTPVNDLVCTYRVCSNIRTIENTHTHIYIYI